MNPFETASRIAYNLGSSVFPLRPKEKIPLRGMSWEPYKSIPADEDQMERWDARHPDANWAVVCGEVSDVIVADSDNEAGEKWCAEHLPSTPCMVRGSRGWHRYYAGGR